MRTPPELTALEAVAGCPLGGRARPAPRLARRGHEPIAALTSAIERTLDNGPPAVAFSGGRDSSLLLAVAALVCRNAGVEPPLPITLCIASPVAEADERVWQERVLEHLQIPRWHRIPIRGELDLIGSYARRHLLSDGLLFPANAHSVVPMLDAAGGRCLIVGLGGDELLTPQQWRSVHDLLGRRRRPQRRDVARLAVAALPRAIRGRLDPPARGSRADDMAASGGKCQLDRLSRRGFEEPVAVGFSDQARCRSPGRGPSLQAMQRLAQASGHGSSSVAGPGIRRRARPRGRPRRVGGGPPIMNALAGDLLPANVVGRTSKAYFNRVFFGEESRAFAAAWSGRGLDETLVDAEALRRNGCPRFPTFAPRCCFRRWLADRDLVADLRLPRLRHERPLGCLAYGLLRLSPAAWRAARWLAVAGAAHWPQVSMRGRRPR